MGDRHDEAPDGYVVQAARAYKDGRWISEASYRSLVAVTIAGTVRAIDCGPETDTVYLDGGETVSAKGGTWIRVHRGDSFSCEAHHILTETDVERGRSPRSFRAIR